MSRLIPEIEDWHVDIWTAGNKHYCRMTLYNGGDTMLVVTGTGDTEIKAGRDACHKIIDRLSEAV